MRSDLDHFAPDIHGDLESILKVIFTEFQDTISSATMGWKRLGRVEKVILFGAHARSRPWQQGAASGDEPGPPGRSPE